MLWNSIGLMRLLCTLSLHFVSAPGFASLPGVGVVEVAIVVLICGTERTGKHWLGSCGLPTQIQLLPIGSMWDLLSFMQKVFWSESLCIFHKDTSLWSFMTGFKLQTRLRIRLHLSARFCPLLECLMLFFCSLKIINCNNIPPWPKTSNHACSLFHTVSMVLKSISCCQSLISYFTGLGFITYLGKELSVVII